MSIKLCWKKKSSIFLTLWFFKCTVHGYYFDFNQFTIDFLSLTEYLFIPTTGVYTQSLVAYRKKPKRLVIDLGYLCVH